ncbi:HEXXH motif domain-containing protein [Kibdelosporangium lantanae]|uniref:HEXXH motif domain-containing protein n=1 Tax=Kibdelosporangium lantanae TaxID=1497396 RepID=A0ABW3M636_9PSEU
MPGPPTAPAESFLHHQVSWPDFNAIARCDGGAAGMHQLRQVERSRRLLLIRALVDEVSASPEIVAPLPNLAAAWDLLSTVQKADTGALESVLDHPYTGAWAAYSSRLLARRTNGIWPLWTHLGYMHTLAAAAAIRAGIDFRIDVPVQTGGVVLPTLGLVVLRADDSVADISGEAGVVEVRSAANHVRLPPDLSVDSPVWQPIRQLKAGPRPVRLDDVDPYRGAYQPLPPEPTPRAEVVAWQRLLAEAWALIARRTPDFADALSVGFESIVPLRPALFRPHSSTHSEAFGSAVLSRPRDAETLAAMIIHEFQHSRLSALEHLVPLAQPDPAERFYAPWRDDPRPVGGLLQGMYAHFGMTLYWRALANPDNRNGEFEYAYHRLVTWQVVDLLRQEATLTGVGRRFVDAIADVLGVADVDESCCLATSVHGSITRSVRSRLMNSRASCRLEYELPPLITVSRPSGSSWSTYRLLHFSRLGSHEPSTSWFSRIPNTLPGTPWKIAISPLYLSVPSPTK